MSESKVTEQQTLIALGILLIIVAVLWYFFQDDVAWLVGQTRLAYLWIFSFFTDKYEAIRAWLAAAKPGQNWADHGTLQWDDVAIISNIIGGYLRWPVAIFLLYGAYWGLKKTPRRRYRTKYNLNSLMQIQARIWPVISPILNFSPTTVSARIPGSPVPAQLPLFAESLTPDEWIAWAGVAMRDGVPDKESLRQAFAKQVGVKWEGMKGLRPYHRALIACFALKGAQKRTESAKLLGLIATCWTAGKGFRMTHEAQKQVDAVLNDKALLQPALDAAKRHAYRTTALLGILKWCRDRGGVLAPAEFVWLRGEDRALWYPLNNLGRRSFHTEAAGAMAHFMAEQVAGRPLPMPRVDNAIPAVLDFLQNNPGPIPSLSGVRDSAKLKMA